MNWVGGEHVENFAFFLTAGNLSFFFWCLLPVRCTMSQANAACCVTDARAVCGSVLSFFAALGQAWLRGSGQLDSGILDRHGGALSFLHLVLRPVPLRLAALPRTATEEGKRK